ncbi:Alpha-tocopherol transfer protein-like [Orchesella cincta]|uniref:Alpha-tocopherol transfer protein-like n=1 Tax=Orchesella cincta TaxID=48709 RepID=A0A1D2NFN5_ORCCI|nr:Alpha-tocopherol transfer protein-like [Orchesella cincta]
MSVDISVEKKVAQLRDLINGEPRLKCQMDHDFLIKFLRARKYDVNASFRTLLQYYEMRRGLGEKLLRFCPDVLHPVLSTNMFVVLKNRDAHGRQILLFRAELWDPTTTSLDDVFLTTLLIGEEMIRSEKTQIHGTVVIQDLKGLTVSHARQFTFAQIKKCIAVLQGAFPAKFKAIHVVNQPYVYDVLLTIAKPFLSRKLMSRITFHGSSLNKLRQAVGENILPESLGGNLGEEEAADLTFSHSIQTSSSYYSGMRDFGYLS